MSKIKNIHIITTDDIEKIQEMLLSNDYKDSQLALEMLNKRDRSDKETEECFDKIKYSLVDNIFLNYTQGEPTHYALKFKDEFLKINGKTVWKTKQGASSAVTNYLNFHTDKIKNLANSFSNGGKKSDGIKNLKKWIMDNKIVEIIEITPK